MTNQITAIFNDDVINLADVTERVEELIEDLKGEDPVIKSANPTDAHDLVTEYNLLIKILDQLSGYGGDHKYNGDYYPGHLISDYYFVEYVRELIEDCYHLKTPDFLVIDWEETAENLKADYSTIEIQGNTFYYR